MVPCQSAAKEVLFHWLHHRFSLRDSKVRTTLSPKLTLRAKGLKLSRVVLQKRSANPAIYLKYNG